MQSNIDVLYVVQWVRDEVIHICSEKPLAKVQIKGVERWSSFEDVNLDYINLNFGLN